MLILVCAALGLCFGSFANVIIIRLHEMSSLHGRSHCVACNKVLRPQHLIPLLSWFWLRGRCAYCQEPIHIQYPLVELAGAILLVIAALRHDPFGSEFPLFIFESVIYFGLLIIVGMDLRWKEMPLELMIGLGIFAVLFHVLRAQQTGMVLITIERLVLGAGVAVGFFGLQWLLSKGRWIGSGDIWFGGVMGFVAGWPGTAVALYLSYLAGGLVVACLLITGVIRRGMRVPFAPALATGLVLTLWFGESIQAWFRYAFSV